MRKLHPWRVALVAVLLLTVAPDAGAAAVRVEGGEVTARVAGDAADGVTRYLGIPYAAPPLAGLRWRPPQPVAPWQGVQEATHFAPACPQPLPPPGSFYQNEFFKTSERQSEDCLYLNVYVPPRAVVRDGAALPVMVWFFGGGFVQGSGSLPSFDGEALARRGVVLVTINYRLGPLGFLALPQLDAESPDHVSGNYGLRDMAAALLWVHNNIAGFGGDPSRVTVFGQSAGALGVGAMMASPLAHGLFARAIAESDPMFGMNDPMQTLAQSEAGGRKFADLLGSQSLTELRMIPSTDLIKAMGTNAVAFGLRPNVDGHVLPLDLPATIAGSGSNAAALLIGTNYNEGTELLQPTTPAGLAALARRRFGAQGDAVADIYKGDDDAAATVAQDRMQSDYLLATAAREAQLFATQGRAAYLYRFTQPAPGSDPKTVGAFHSAELAYVFGTQASIDRPWSGRDHELSDQMQSYWTNFARTGDPNGNGLPAWPRFAPGTQQAMELGSATAPIDILEPRIRALFDAYLMTRLPQ